MLYLQIFCGQVLFDDTESMEIKVISHEPTLGHLLNYIIRIIGKHLLKHIQLLPMDFGALSYSIPFLLALCLSA